MINLEHVGNIVASRLMEFAVKKIQRSQPFSGDEIQAIAAIHAELLESLRLALEVNTRSRSDLTICQRDDPESRLR